MTDGTLDVQVDPAAFRAFMAATKAFSPTLMKQLRVRLRTAASVAVTDVQASLHGPTPGGAPFEDGDARSDIADATKVSILSGVRTAGVRIAASSDSPMLKLYNKASFRHPVPNSNAWVAQEGRPYFGAVISKRKADIQAAVVNALQDALNASGGAITNS